MATALQLQSTVRKDGKLELALAEVDVPKPGSDQVLIRIEAAPINPSDLGVLYGPADMTTATQADTGDRPRILADVPKHLMAGASARIDKPLPVGNEGAGIVVEAGESDAAQALMGDTVAVIGGAMYGQYRCVPAQSVMPLPKGTTPAEGASCFVNPLTALGMVETLHLEGHPGLVHTAAASNLGQMLVKLCESDGVPLVNIVRRQEHVELLKGLGAKHVLDSTSASFKKDLIQALTETGATLGFDATGGGDLASQILTCMERALLQSSKALGPYGSTTHKQVYLYGSLDMAPTQLDRSFGMAWGVGGWLLPPFLERVGGKRALELQKRVAQEIKTTFASQYTQVISLRDALKLETLEAYTRKATGEKFLIDPSQD